MDYRYREPVEVFERDGEGTPVSFAIEDDGSQMFFAHRLKGSPRSYVYVGTDRDSLEPVINGDLPIVDHIVSPERDTAYLVTYVDGGIQVDTKSPGEISPETLPSPSAKMGLSKG